MRVRGYPAMSILLAPNERSSTARCDVTVAQAWRAVHPGESISIACAPMTGIYTARPSMIRRPGHQRQLQDWRAAILADAAAVLLCDRTAYAGPTMGRTTWEGCS